MPRISPTHSRRVINALRRMGFVFIRKKGSHAHLKDPKTNKLVTVLDPTELGPGMIRKILRQANITWEELLKYLMMFK